MKQSRRWTALVSAPVLAITMAISGVLSGVVTAPAASASTTVVAPPAPVCTKDISTDTCGISPGPTGLVQTLSIPLKHPVCLPNSTNAPCDYSITHNGPSGGGVGGPFSGSISCDYATPLAMGTSTVTCTVTWTWPVGGQPSALYVGVFENNGEAITQADGSHYFQVTYAHPKPSVSYTTTADPSTKGLYHFVSTSTVTSSPAAHQWIIDGEYVGTNSDTLNYTFPHSGTFNVSLRITDGFNQQTTSTPAPVNVTFDDLQASIALTGPGGVAFTGGATTVGSTVTVTATIKSRPDAQANITGIAISPLFTLDPSSGAVSEQSSTGSAPTTLTPGQMATYSKTYSILSSGQTKFSLHATGTEGATALTADASATAHFGQPLTTEISWKKDGVALPNNTLKLKDNDDGEIPQDVTAVVKLTNTSKLTETGITLYGPPALSFHDPSTALPKLPLTVTAGPLPADPIPDLPPDGTVTRTYTVHVTNNGAFDFQSTVLSSAQGSNDNSVSVGTGTLTVLPTAVLWLKLHPVNDITKLLTPGVEIRLSGSLTNRSQTQSVDVDPLEPNVDGNAGGGGLYDASEATLPDGVRLPVAGQIKPATTIEIETVIGTSEVPGTRATVEYKLHGLLVQSTGAEIDLTPDQIGMTAGSTPFALHFDTSEHPPSSDLGTVAANFAGSAFAGASLWLAGNLRAGLTFLRHPVDGAGGLVSGTAKAIVATTVAANEAAHLIGAMYVLSVGYASMSEEERGNFANQIVADYEQSSIHTAHQALQNAADPVLLNFQTALQTGDYNKVAQMAGTGLATGAGAAADLLLTDIAFQKLALFAKAKGAAFAESKLANTISLAQAIRDAKVIAKAGAALKDIKAGDNLLAKGARALTDTYGMTQSQITRLRAFCQQNKIVVAVRSRSKAAAELIRKGLAVGKNEVIKLKNVNEIDVQYLGYSKHDLNTIVWAEPIPLERVTHQLASAGASAEERELVLARYHQRAAEWTDPKINKVIHHAEETGKIDWGFNGTDNGASAADRKGVRRFALKHQPSPLKGTKDRFYTQVLVGNSTSKTARLVKVTQDVDMVAILAADGSILPPALRAKAYAYLADIIGIEHPETVSWILNGEILFNAKAKFLADHLRGAEALAVFAPTGAVTAGFFNPAMCIYNLATKSGRIFFEGGYNNPYAYAVQKIANKLFGRG